MPTPTIEIIYTSYIAMNSITGNLDKRWYDALKDGSKICEGRPNNEKYGNCDVGTEITWKCRGTNESVSMVVTKIERYANFTDLVSSVGVENVLPGFDDVETGVSEIYDAIYGEGFENVVALYFN